MAGRTSDAKGFPQASCPNCVQRLMEAANLRSRVMRNTVGNSTPAKLHPLDLAQLVLCLLASDPVHSVPTLGVVDETEVLASLLDRDHVHEAGGEGRVGADLAVDFDEALHEN